MPLTITDAQLDDAARALDLIKHPHTAGTWELVTKTQRRKLRGDVMRLLVALGQHDFVITDPDPAPTPKETPT